MGDVEIEELLDRRISRVGPHGRVNSLPIGATNTLLNSMQTGMSIAAQRRSGSLLLNSMQDMDELSSACK